MKHKVIWCFSIISIIAMFIIGIYTIRTFVFPTKYLKQVLIYSNKYNLDPYLILAIINTESNFNKEATSIKNAKGLMQITDSTAKEVNEVTNSTSDINDTSLYNEDINIEIGCKYFASLISRYNGNYYLAICAYNAGIGNVNSWLNDNRVSSSLDTTDIKLPFDETTKYLKKVIVNYDLYKKIYPSFS